MKMCLSEYGIKVPGLSITNVKRLYKEIEDYLSIGNIPEYIVNN